MLVQLAILMAAWIAFQSAAQAAAIVINGGFDGGIDGWEISGAVVGSSGIAVITDTDAARSLFFQPVPATIEQFAIAFDFRNALSETVPAGRLADSFFATLYFT
ncbi:MAG TPA: hypothetical protein VFV83_05435, partial [Chthoniobacteraceae bacterium]|nr:hypothetical protein [Chthoniobacteraceae bacterium]